MPRACPLQQLRTLSHLLASTQGADPEGGTHVRRVLELVDQQPESLRSRLSLKNTAERLASLHFGPEEERQVAFAHWHVSELTECSPLWLRQSVIGKLKSISGRRRGCFIVTGVRDAICPPGSYWTRKRQARYHRICQWIDVLSVARAPTGFYLQVIVL